MKVRTYPYYACFALTTGASFLIEAVWIYHGIPSYIFFGLGGFWLLIGIVFSWAFFDLRHMKRKRGWDDYQLEEWLEDPVGWERNARGLEVNPW